MAKVTITKTALEVPSQTVEVDIPQRHIPSKAGEGLPPIQSIALIAALSAVLAYGIVQAVKQAVKGYALSKGSRKGPWWLSGLLRALSVVFGSLAGWLLFDPMGADGVKYWGAIIGGCGGALATIIVQQVKARIRGK